MVTALQAVIPGLTAMMAFLAVYAFLVGGRGAFRRPPEWTGGFPSASEVFASWFATAAVWLLPICVVGWVVIALAALF
jgi:hypothetical protein